MDAVVRVGDRGVEVRVPSRGPADVRLLDPRNAVGPVDVTAVLRGEGDNVGAVGVELLVAGVRLGAALGPRDGEGLDGDADDEEVVLILACLELLLLLLVFLLQLALDLAVDGRARFAHHEELALVDAVVLNGEVKVVIDQGGAAGARLGHAEGVAALVGDLLELCGAAALEYGGGVLESCQVVDNHVGAVLLLDELFKKRGALVGQRGGAVEDLAVVVKHHVDIVRGGALVLAAEDLANRLVAADEHVRAAEGGVIIVIRDNVLDRVKAVDVDVHHVALAIGDGAGAGDVERAGGEGAAERERSNEEGLHCFCCCVSSVSSAVSKGQYVCARLLLCEMISAQLVAMCGGG